MSKKNVIATAILILTFEHASMGQTIHEDWGGPLSPAFCTAPDFTTWCRFDLNFDLDVNGDPTGPKAWGPGVFDTSSGDLHLGTTGAVPILDPPLPEPKDPLFFDFANSGVLGLAWGPSFVDPRYGNGFVRTKVRVGENSTAGFGFRFDLTQFAGYVFSIGEVRGFEFTENAPFQSVQLHTIEGLEPKAGEWWWMEGGGVGSQLSLKAWKDGEPEPKQPQLQITDDTYIAGAVGPAGYVQTGFVDAATQVSVTYDDFTFNPVHPKAVPRLAGEIEDVWTSDRPPSWLEGPSYGHGDIWFADPGNIFAETPEPTRLMRFDPDTGTTTEALDLAANPNIFGTEFDRGGKLISTHLGLGTVSRRSVDDLNNPETLADGLAPEGGGPFIPNDLVVDGDGGIYFTSFMLNAPPELGDSAVYYLSPGGNLSKAFSFEGSRDANGIGISPDGKTLYVALAFQGQVRAIDIVDSGELTNDRVFAAAPGGVDGITVDRWGNVFVSDLGLSLPPMPQPDLPGSVVRVFNPAGEEVLTFDPPHGVINMTFDANDNLYIAGWNTLSRVPIQYIPEPSGSILALIGIFALVRRIRYLDGGPTIASDFEGAF